MAASHEALGARVVSHAGGRVLLHPLSGERVELEPCAQLAFAGGGWGYIVEGSSTRWVKAVLQVGVAFDEHERAYLIDKSKGGRVTWLTDAVKQREVLVVAITVEGETRSLAAFRMGAPTAGQQVFWDVRCVQEMLGLELTARFASRWACQQWSSWGAFFAATGLPASGLQCGPRGKDFEASLGLECWCVSTCGLLALLARWSSSLRSAGSAAKASKVLEAIVQHGLPASWSVDAALDDWGLDRGDCWPQGGGAGHTVRLEVLNGMVSTRALVAAVPALGTKLMRP